MDLYVHGYAQSPTFTRFPPSAMTSNSQTISGNTYTASKSQGDGNPYIIFDYSNTTPWYPSAGLYSATGEFIGTTKTVTTDGTSYAGVWVQLYCSQSFYLTSHTYKGETTVPTRYPAAFAVFGSTDGTNWTLVDYHTSVTYTGNSASFSTSSFAPYHYYRMVTIKTKGDLTTTWTEWELSGSVTPPVATFSYDFRPPADLENTICDSYVYGYRAIPGRYIDVNSSNRWVTYTSKKLGRYISNVTTADVSYTGNQFRATYTPSGGTAVTLASGNPAANIFYTPSQFVTFINNQLNSLFGSGKVVCSFDFDNDTWLYTFTCPTAGDTISIDHTFEWGSNVLGFNSTKTGNVITSDTVVFQTSTITAALEINVGTSLDSLVAQLNIIFQNNNAKAWNISFTAEVVNQELIRILATLPTDEIVLSSMGTIWSRLGFPTDTSLPNSIESTPVINTVAVEDYTWLSSGWRQPTLYRNTYLGPGPVPVYIPSGQQTADFTVSGIMTSNAIYDVEFFLRLVSRTH